MRSVVQLAADDKSKDSGDATTTACTIPPDPPDQCDELTAAEIALLDFLVDQALDSPRRP